MSSHAPWLALSVDWQDSEMFDGATPGARLAWVCLLCHVKAKGRGGSARFRPPAFASEYRLSTRSVLEMLERAQKCGAAIVEGDIVTLCNWTSYQRRVYDANHRNNTRISRAAQSGKNEQQDKTGPSQDSRLTTTTDRTEDEVDVVASLRSPDQDPEAEAAWRDFERQLAARPGVRSSLAIVRKLRRLHRHPEDAGESWYVSPQKAAEAAEAERRKAVLARLKSLSVKGARVERGGHEFDVYEHELCDGHGGFWRYVTLSVEELEAIADQATVSAPASEEAEA